MIAGQLHLIGCLLLIAQPQTGTGTIRGVVLNASRGDLGVEAAEVLLRVRSGGEFVAAARVTTDQAGHFLFDGLPLDQELEYLPGASQDGIHYPGPHLRLSVDQSSAEVVLKVHDAITEPSPLVIRDWNLVLDPAPGSLHVTETLLIENPGNQTFVGRDSGGRCRASHASPWHSRRLRECDLRQGILRASILHDRGKARDGNPLDAGAAALRFSYVLRNQERRRAWVRAVDLPCQHVRLIVHGADPGGVSCNLGTPCVGQDGSVAFESNNRDLPAGYVLRVELSRLPVPVMAYARWVVLAVLALAIAGSCWGITRRRRREVRGETRKTFHRPAGKARVQV